MIQDRRFSAEFGSNLTVTQPTGDVQSWDTYFAPDDDIHSVLITELKLAAAEQQLPEVHSSQFGFTLADVADEFVLLSGNINSRFLFDRSQAQGHTEAPLIADFLKRVPESQVAVGTSPKAHQILHTKAVAILYPDGTGWTFTGSWNVSNSADEQFNIVDVVRSRSRAELFANKIDEMFDWVAQHEPPKS
jgi:hypothetical protein